jgi:hypothetical protein
MEEGLTTAILVHTSNWVKMRVMRMLGFLLTLVFVCPPALAQSVPNFSGVFLRDPIRSPAAFLALEDPLVLNITQDADTLQVTKAQNGALATYTYHLNGRPAINAGPDGLSRKDRIKFKRGNLIIKSEWREFRFGRTALETKETWRLSPDVQTLTIQPDIAPGGIINHGTATYTRQISLRAAFEKANEESQNNKCQTLPSLPATSRPPKLDHEFLLGYTGFEELVWTVSFDARLGGEFFDDLDHTKVSGGVEFRKNGVLIRTYSGSLNLEVTPRVELDTWLQLSPWTTSWNSQPFPEWLRTLRFRIKWVGSETRDLGEVPSEFRQAAWPELAPSDKWFVMKIPAQDVPLTDSLEVHILSAEGNQLGCISGHI